jgi:predicted HicB family RNase H-like nuclease
METKQLIVEIAEELHKRLKVISAEKGIPMKRLVIEAIEELLNK